MMVTSRKKLAIVVSHPIQHFVPFYRAISKAKLIDLTVLFCSRIGLVPYFDHDMNRTVSWRMDLVSGYNHVFLKEADSITSVSFRNIDNPSVRAELFRQRPDFVLIYGYNYITSLRTLYWCRQNNVPAIMVSDSELKSARPLPVRLIKRFILPIIFRYFSAFLTVGDCNNEYYRSHGVPLSKLFRSPFTIDEEIYQAAYQNREALSSSRRASLAIAGDEVVALTVGKLSSRKRPNDLIQVARIVKATGNPHKLRFLLVGDGKEMAKMEEVIEREGLPVSMAGFVNVDVLPEYYAAADFILHPSSRDPHPLVLSEGACMGLPLIVSDRVGAVGPTDIARLGENALMFPVGDVIALEKCVTALAGDARSRTIMSVRSHEIFSELDMMRSVRGILDAVDYLSSDGRNEQSSY